MTILRGCLALTLVAALALSAAPRSTLAAGATYYVDAVTGNDANPGSAAQPWRSLARVQTALDAGAIRAGDRVLFARGSIFEGRLSLNAAVGGTASAPITFGAYGAGKPAGAERDAHPHGLASAGQQSLARRV